MAICGKRLPIKKGIKKKLEQRSKAPGKFNQLGGKSGKKPKIYEKDTSENNGARERM